MLAATLVHLYQSYAAIPAAFTFLLQLRPVFLPQVYLPAECLPLPLQLTTQHSNAQMHALPLFLLQERIKERENKRKQKENISYVITATSGIYYPLWRSLNSY